MGHEAPDDGGYDGLSAAFDWPLGSTFEQVSGTASIQDGVASSANLLHTPKVYIPKFIELL